MNKKISISLIISTYNWPVALDLILLSIKNLSEMPNEVIVADDGSGEETKKLIENAAINFPVPLKHIWHEDTGWNKTTILNKAIKESKSDYIVQIDGDVILHTHFIKDHKKFAEPNTFLRGGRTMLSDLKTKEVISSRRIKFGPLSSGISKRLNAVRIPLLAKFACTKEESSKDVLGCNFSFWKSDFIKVNGYDNEFFGWGHEDEELAARFVNSGLYKKNLKFAGVAYHLYHKKQAKELAEKHWEIIKRTNSENVVYCKSGINDL